MNKRPQRLGALLFFCLLAALTSVVHAADVHVSMIRLFASSTNTEVVVVCTNGAVGTGYVQHDPSEAEVRAAAEQFCNSYDS